MQKAIAEKERGFQTLVLNVISQEITPDLSAQRDQKVNENFKAVLREPLEVLRGSHSWKPNLSPKQMFCWGVISSCCSKIIVLREKFDWLHFYSSIIIDLSEVFNHYCRSIKLADHQRMIATELPSGILDHSSADLKRYA